MIEPIKISIQQGTHKAIGKVSENGIEVKFENPTPIFQTDVMNILDGIAWGDDKILAQLQIDKFERSEK